MINYSIRMAAKTAVIMAAATVAFTGAAAVRAQDDARNQTDEQLLACDRISDPAEKMACFNAVVDNLKQSPAASAAESPSESPPSIAPASEAPAAIAPATGATAAAIPTEPSEPEPAAELESSSPGEMPDEPTANSEIVVDDFGLEDQEAAEAKQKEMEQRAKSETGTVHATIVRSEKSGLNHFVVLLDNGQVWEETDGSRRLVGLPPIGTPVKVYKGRLGGYRMKVGDDNRIAWVRRLK